MTKSAVSCFQFPADLVTFTEEILDGKLHFLCSDTFFKEHLPVAATYRKIPVLESLFNSDYCKMFKSKYFEEHQRTAASPKICS